MLDASRSVTVCSSLMNKDGRDAYIQNIKDEYAKSREAHLNKKSDKRFVTIDQARQARFQVSLDGDVAPKPTFTGTKVFESYPLGKNCALYRLDAVFPIPGNCVAVILKYLPISL